MVSEIKLSRAKWKFANEFGTTADVRDIFDTGMVQSALYGTIDILIAYLNYCVLFLDGEDISEMFELCSLRSPFNRTAPGL